jgi:hypothetical protein
MSLIKNTLIFVDTGFFKNYKPGDAAYTDFFEYSKNENVVLCTSRICVEEWRTQKLKDAKNFIDETRGKLGNLLGANPLARKVLADCFTGDFLEADWLVLQSTTYTQDFITGNKIKIYDFQERHMAATWDSYFHGKDPFESAKRCKDIPDAWVFEAARDAMNEHRQLQNKFCIGGDSNLCGALQKLSFEPISVIDLLAKLQPAPKQVSQEAPAAQYDVAATDVAASTVEVAKDQAQSELDRILATAINEQTKEVYIRLLGYSHWMNGPDKKSLTEAIAARGYEPKIIEACAVILAQEPLQLLKDTGNHILPVNRPVCKDAANRIMSEILEFLDRG